jgi:MFS family permease
VYQSEQAQRQDPLARLIGRRDLQVSRNVWHLGLTSLFTDISSEMVTSVLPAYLVLQRGLSPLGFGAIDGLYQSVGSLARWIGGAAADRWRRHKEVAAAGYALSAASKIGLLAAGGAWTAIAGVIALDRIGKGVRTAPRDALISLSSPPARLATAFGVHRALDAVGALLGPLAAFSILAFSPAAFDRVFVVSLSAALVGLGILVLFVDNVPGTGTPAASIGSTTVALRLLQIAKFRHMVLGAGALSLATLSDAFVYLGLQRRGGFSGAAFPLLALATAGAYLLLAIPAGRLADRIGRGRVFLLGHLMLFGIYGILVSAGSGVAMAMTAVLLLGTYYAMTDGVLAAGASAILDPDIRGRGLALLGLAVSLSRLIASIAFGWAWTRWGADAAVMCFAVGLIVALAAAGRSLSGLESAGAGQRR